MAPVQKLAQKIHRLVGTGKVSHAISRSEQILFLLCCLSYLLFKSTAVFAFNSPRSLTNRRIQW